MTGTTYNGTVPQMTSDTGDALPPPCEACGMPLLAAEASGRHDVCPVVGLNEPGRRAYLVARDRQQPRLVALQYRLACGGSFIDEGNAPHNEV